MNPDLAITDITAIIARYHAHCLSADTAMRQIAAIVCPAHTTEWGAAIEAQQVKAQEQAK